MKAGAAGDATYKKKQDEIIPKTSRWSLTVLALCLAGAPTALAAGPALPRGASSLSENYGDWTVSCHMAAAKGQTGPSCAMQQVLTNDKKQRILVISLQPRASGEIATELLLPFGVSVSQPIRLAVDGTDPGKPTAFATCFNAGCLVPVAMDKTELGRLGAGKTLLVRAEVFPSGAVKIPVSLNGFGAALKRLQELSPPAK